jgi:hypothetical protein
MVAIGQAGWRVSPYKADGNGLVVSRWPAALCALEQLKGFLESAATMYGAWRARISAFARRSRSNAAE